MWLLRVVSHLTMHWQLACYQNSIYWCVMYFVLYFLFYVIPSTILITVIPHIYMFYFVLIQLFGCWSLVNAYLVTAVLIV